jgi:hypothetical protein
MAAPEHERYAPGPVNFFKKSTMALLTMAALLAPVAKTTGGLADIKETTLTAQTDIGKEYLMPNNLTIFGRTEEEKDALLETISEFPTVWDNEAPHVVDLPEEEKLQVTLKPGAKIEAAKVYPLGPEARKLVDETFDRLYGQDKMEWTR